MSRKDSLVVVWAGDERGRGKEAHQRVKRLVGGRLGLGRGREGEGGPPTSRKDSLAVDRAWEGEENHPTSQYDSLGVAGTGAGGGKGSRPTNKSKGLVGGR